MSVTWEFHLSQVGRAELGEGKGHSVGGFSGRHPVLAQRLPAIHTQPSERNRFVDVGSFVLADADGETD